VLADFEQQYNPALAIASTITGTAISTTKLIEKPDFFHIINVNYLYLWTVAKQTKYHIGIEIDKLTNSIFNTISGDSFPTDAHPITKVDLKM
jgi:hypothetical protein